MWEVNIHRSILRTKQSVILLWVYNSGKTRKIFDYNGDFKCLN